MKKILVVILAAVMLAAGVNAAFERVNSYSNNFSDVTDANWFYENVKTAYELGFMNGKSEGKFDPSGNVTVVEAVTMASRLHAKYRGGEVTKKVIDSPEVRFDFDNGTEFVPYGKDGIYLFRANAKIENDMLVFQPDAPNSVGNYNPQVFLEGINLDARAYDKLTVRIKRENLPNVDPSKPRNDTIMVYFKTIASPTITADQVVKLSLGAEDKFADWYEFSVELGSSEKWKDTIKGIRLDPTSNNGVYYIDSMVFSKSSDTSNEKWYDMYIDYAVDNGIIEPTTFDVSEYNRNITRAEMCTLFASALPEECYAPINNVKGIPDVMRDEKNADVYLMLYRAGILLGSDAQGTFNPDSDIKRSEVAAIINRAALPEMRVKGEISHDWAKQGNKYDLEFDDASSLEKYEYVGESVEIKNGAVVIKPQDRQNLTPRFASRVIAKNINIDASEYSKLRIRMKPEFVGVPEKTNVYFYFHTDEDAGFSDLKSMSQNLVEFSYIDAAGWYVLEVDLSLHPEWKGNITSIRFDPGSVDGVFTIDYIRLANADPLNGASHQVLLNEGYTATGIVQDPTFERGFYVSHFEQKQVDLEQRKWQTGSTEKPLWQIGPWWSDHDLWENRDPANDAYTVSDTYGINSIKYNPEEKSLTMRLNGTKIYNGQPHIAEERYSWPHFLIDQNSSICSFDKKANSANADRMFLELDVRLADYKPTTNPDGVLVCDFLAFFYLQTDKAPGQRIWFGFDLFKGAKLDASEKATPMWAKDSAAKQYIYGIPSAVVYDGIENSLNPEPGVALVGSEWKHVRLDVTKHIARAVEWANRDNAFGVPVTVEDMFISGMNIGYEMRGNFDCTIEFKNFNMIAYNK